MGTDVRTMFDKDYLYSYDLQGRDVTVVIDRVKAGELTGVGGKKNKKPVVFFKGAKKGLGLNITNARTIAGMYGGFEVEKWIGKSITLYPTTTTFGDRTVDCIRIRPEIPKAGKSTTPHAQQSSIPLSEREDVALDEDEMNRRAEAALAAEEMRNAGR